jgi:hypothetical protein
MSASVRPMPPALSLAPEVGAAVRTAQGALEQEARRAHAINDPTGPMLTAFSQAIGAMHQLYVDGTLTIGKQIEAVVEAKPGLTDEQISAMTRDIGTRLLANHARFANVERWRTVSVATVVAVVALVCAFIGGYYWHDSRQLVAGISAGQQECREERRGTLCFIPVWAKPPPQ